MIYWIKLWDDNYWRISTAHNNGGHGFNDINAACKELERARLGSHFSPELLFDYILVDDFSFEPLPPFKNNYQL